MMIVSFLGISFEIPVFLLLIIPAIAVFVFVNRDVLRKGGNLHLMAMRSAAMAVLLLVLAMPHVTKEESIMQETTSILVIDDHTGSMRIYGGSAGGEVASAIEAGTGGVSKVELRNLSAQDYTALGDAIYQGILGSSLKNNVVILASDGNSNRGADALDVAAFAAETNARIFSVVPELKGSEVYVEDIGGSDKAPVNSEYAGKVSIGGIGGEASYTLRVFIDEEKVLDTPVLQNTPRKEFPFEHVFNSKGPHRITARIFPDSPDEFPQNDIFNKVVEVVERPKLLLVTSSESSPLSQVLGEVYDVDVEVSLTSDIGEYDAIILDDQPSDSIGSTDRIREFLADGGGLLVVGGNHSYNNGGYYESAFESLLPVKSSEVPDRKGEQINVVILIDISGSTGVSMSGNSKIDVEKAIAVKMVRDLADKAHVGVVAFNSNAYVIQSIRKTGDTGQLEEKIARLQFGGGTYVLEGLIKARDMLRTVQGSRYVILISDGVTNYPVQVFEEAGHMANDDFTTHTIGVGFDTDVSFMRGLAMRGNGVYFEPRETDRVRILFGGLEDGEEEDGGRFSMILTDTHHFITEGLTSINVSIDGFNKVSGKASAQVLAATRDLKPLLAVWRFGLGRVASLAVDNGGEWVNRLYTGGNSRIISSTVNWIIGDPEERGAFHMECSEARVGEEAPIIVSSEREYPALSVDGENRELNRIDDRRYYMAFVPDTPGFVQISADESSCEVAVNYPREYGRFNINLDMMTAMGNITNGGVYPAESIDALINEVTGYTISESTGVKIKKTNLQLWFTLAALLIFFADVVVRRVSEIRRGGE